MSIYDIDVLGLRSLAASVRRVASESLNVDGGASAWSTLRDCAEKLERKATRAEIAQQARGCAPSLTGLSPEEAVRRGRG